MKLKAIIFAGIMILVTGSCLKIEDLSSAADSSGIEFLGEIGTKSLDPLDNDNMHNFGVFASYEESAGFNSSTPLANYIDNEPYLKDDSGTWAWKEQQYWPVVGKLSFFAYTPYVEDLEMTSVNGKPSILFTPLKDVTSQIDFCTAEPEFNRSKTTEAIPLHFRHALSGVIFKVNYIGSLPQNQYYVKINEITIKNLIGSKYVSYIDDEPYAEWEADDDAGRSDYYTIYRSKNAEVADIQLPKRNDDNNNHVELNPLTGRLFIIPQTIDPDVATINIKYGFYLKNSSMQEKVLTLFEVEHPLPDAVLKPNTITNFIFTLDIGKCSIVDLTSSLETWIEKWQSTPEIHYPTPAE